jgi:hypothetical protein
MFPPLKNFVLPNKANPFNWSASLYWVARWSFYAPVGAVPVAPLHETDDARALIRNVQNSQSDSAQFDVQVQAGNLEQRLRYSHPLMSGNPQSAVRWKTLIELPGASKQLSLRIPSWLPGAHGP